MTLFVADLVRSKDKTIADQWAQYVTDDDTYCIVNIDDEDYTEFLMASAHYGDPVVALGNEASRALYEVPHFKLPHPGAGGASEVEKELKECKTFIQKTKVRQNRSDK